MLGALLSDLVNSVYLLGVLLVSAGTGSKLLRLARLQPSSLAEELAFGTTLGLGLISYVTFGAGLLGLLYSPLVYGLLAALLVWTWRDARVLQRSRLLRGERRVGHPSPDSLDVHPCRRP